MLPFHPCLPRSLFCSGFSTKTCCVYFSSPHACFMPRPSHPPRFYHPNDVWWRVQIVKLFLHILMYSAMWDNNSDLLFAQTFDIYIVVIIAVSYYGAHGFESRKQELWLYCDVGFSCRWLSCGLLRRLVWWNFTDVSEVFAASIIRAMSKWEAESTSETSVNFHQTERRNNPENNHLHIFRRENLRYQLGFSCLFSVTPYDYCRTSVFFPCSCQFVIHNHRCYKTYAADMSSFNKEWISHNVVAAETTNNRCYSVLKWKQSLCVRSGFTTFMWTLENYPPRTRENLK
jgi:hypothetical protein